jgi:hypothetical protein
VSVPMPFDILAAWLAKCSTVINAVLVIMYESTSLAFPRHATHLLCRSVAKISKKAPQPRSAAAMYEAGNTRANSAFLSSPARDDSSTTINRNSGHLYSAMRVLFSLQVEDTPPAGSSEGVNRHSTGVRFKGSSAAVDVVSPIIPR